MHKTAQYPNIHFFLLAQQIGWQKSRKKTTFRYPTILLSRHMANGVPYNCTHRLLTVTGESQM